MKKPSPVGPSADGDARQLGHDAQHRLRAKVVQLHLQGQTRSQICAASGLSYTAVRKVIQLYLQGGDAALVPKLRGRQSGQKRRLSAEQEIALQDCLLRERPQPDDSPTGLWERDAVARLVQHTCALALPTRTLDHYLQRWGFKPNQSVFANARREPQCQAILAAARARGMTVLWLQVVALQQQLTQDTAHVLFSTNNRGQAQWLAFSAALDLATICESLRTTRKDTLLLMVHLADPDLRQALEHWWAAHSRTVQCCFLPALEMATVAAVKN